MYAVDLAELQATVDELARTEEALDSILDEVAAHLWVGFVAAR